MKLVMLYGVDRIHEYLAITLCGTLNNVPLYKTAKSDFYTIKGIVESVLGLIGIEQPRYQYSRVERIIIIIIQVRVFIYMLVRHESVLSV